MRATYVSLSFVLCAVVIVGSCPLHQLEVDSSVGEHSLISSFQSPQKESIMGGFISRNRRREDKEKDSPRLESFEAEPNQNENEVDERKKRFDELELNTDDNGDEGEQVDPCETSPCVPTTFDEIDSAPSLPLYPSLEGMELNVEEVMDSNRQMRSLSHSNETEEETMENPGGISEVSHPLFQTNPSEAEVKEGEVGQAEKERNQRSSPMFPDPDVIDNEEDITVDVSNQGPVMDSSLHRDEEPTFLQEEVIEIIDEPENDRLMRSSPYRSGVILGPVLIDEEPEIIVDVMSEVRPAFDPSLHLMAEPVIYHPQPVPIDDFIELEMAIDDELGLD
ncbi:uncharacterized protein LOC124351075 isoform X2 [Daphnia pulicaria]|uniref:uncharacterized protein LOC124351075 isoform X2 n=1 Tax=Daphnia pulicaria TaxID=35523 RepID=UPI001EEC0F97|nr:uncharacterized protein LOC124351075 isoform X2 [Daphnia pulicaria]